jgi:thioredoxin 1
MAIEKPPPIGYARTMKWLWAGLLAAGTVASADTIQQTSGKIITAQVVSYDNGTFFVTDANQTTSKLPAAAILKIEFDPPGPAAEFETRSGGTVKGQLLRYDAGQFHLTVGPGQTRVVPGLMVTRANLGGGGGADPGRAVANVNSGPIEKHLVAGKVTIVDFYAEWCGPCRAIGPKLEELARSDDAVVLRKVNVDKNRALAAQHGVRGIPHIIVFDKNGKSLGTVVGADLDGVKRLIAKGKS